MQIGFGANDNAWDVLRATKIYDLVVHVLDHVERIPRSDGVNQDISVDANSILGVKDRIFVLNATSVC